MTSTSTTIVRPEPAEELAMEAEARAAGGVLAYRRRCPQCGERTTPVHPDGTAAAQHCGNCGHRFLGVPLTWMVRDDPEGGTMLILRRGDYCQAMRAPQRPDQEVSESLVDGAWASLERTVLAASGRAG